MLFQTCVNVFVLLNTKEDILKKLCNQDVLGKLTFGATLKKNTGAPELLCFPHSSEYLPLCSAKQRYCYRFETT